MARGFGHYSRDYFSQCGGWLILHGEGIQCEIINFVVASGHEGHSKNGYFTQH